MSRQDEMVWGPRPDAEMFWVKTETRSETHRSETEMRPRRWAFWPRLRRDISTSRDPLETETTSLVRCDTNQQHDMCYSIYWSLHAANVSGNAINALDGLRWKMEKRISGRSSDIHNGGHAMCVKYSYQGQFRNISHVFIKPYMVQ